MLVCMSKPSLCERDWRVERLEDCNSGDTLERSVALTSCRRDSQQPLTEAPGETCLSLGVALPQKTPRRPAFACKAPAFVV